jgi:HAD superfamily hydrolase (TIGR01509 family)
MRNFIIFDCFGTLVTRPPFNAYQLVEKHLKRGSFEEVSRFIKTSPDALTHYAKEWFNDSANVQALQQDIAAEISAQMQEIHPLPETEAILKEFSGQHCIYSNISPGYDKVFRKLPGAENIELSFNVGQVKPSRQVFEYLAKKYNLTSADTVLLVDDKPSNIKAAIDFGWRGLLVDKEHATVEGVLRALE